MPTAQVEINGKMATVEYPEGMSQEDVIARVKTYHSDNIAKADNVVKRLGADFGVDENGEPLPVQPTTPTSGVNATPIAEMIAKYAKNGVDVGPINISSPTSMLNPKRGMAALAGAASMIPGSDMLSAFVGHNIENVIRPFKGEAPAGMSDYLDRLARHKDIRKEIEAGAPMEALAGKMAGGVAGSVAGLSRAATPLQRILASVGTNIGVGQQNVDLTENWKPSDESASDRLTKSVEDLLSTKNAKQVGLDSLLALIPSSLIEGYSAAKKPAADLVERAMESPFVKDKLGRLVKSIPMVGDYIESGQKAKATAARDLFTQKETTRRVAYDSAIGNKKAAFEAEKLATKQAQENAVETARGKVKALPEIGGVSDARGAGESFINATDELDAQLAKDVSAAAKPVLAKYGTSKIPVKSARAVVTEALKGQDLLDAKGYVDNDAIKSIAAPQRKAFAEKLGDLSFTLQKNPTVKEMKSLLEDVAEYANFEGKDRTRYERTFGKLYNSMKDAFYDGLQNVADPAEAKALIAARTNYSQTRPSIDIARKLTKGGTPEVAVERARNVLKGSSIDAVLKSTPTLKVPIQQVILADLSRASDNAKSFSKVIDKYGRGSLKKLLGDKYAQIEQIEQEFASVSKSQPTSKLSVAKFKPHKFAYEQPRPIVDAINKRMSNVQPIDSEKIKKLMSYIIGAQGAVEGME